MYHSPWKEERMLRSFSTEKMVASLVVRGRAGLCDYLGR